MLEKKSKSPCFFDNFWAFVQSYLSNILIFNSHNSGFSSALGSFLAFLGAYEKEKSSDERYSSKCWWLYEER